MDHLPSEFGFITPTRGGTRLLFGGEVAFILSNSCFLMYPTALVGMSPPVQWFWCTFIFPKKDFV